MLGINAPYDRKPKPYRNYAAVNPGDGEYAELERLGAVERCGGVPWSEYDYFRCTEAGKAAAMASHKSIQCSKAKRVYHRFLDLSDCCPDLTFKEFLTNPKFEEARASA